MSAMSPFYVDVKYTNAKYTDYKHNTGLYTLYLLSHAENSYIIIQIRLIFIAELIATFALFIHSETKKTTECFCIERQTMRRYKHDKLTDEDCDAIAY